MPPDGYVTETEYIWGYFDEMSPHALCHVARMNGHAAPRLDRPFSYLELGCGHGLTALTLAACHPHATFHAVDLNEQHIQNAQRLQQAGQVDNLTFHRATFEQIVETDLPDFDFITLHGVYSWVSAEVRAQIRAVIARKLRPGGLVYISYNALPGWASTLPFRQILLSYTARLDGPLLERTLRGLEYLRFLRDNASAYFKDNPKASSHLDHLLKQDVRYVAHEFLNGHWNAFYFHEVEADMRACDLLVAGCLPASRNLMDLCVPPAFHALLRSAETRSVYETHRDFVLDERFRRDVYVRPPSDAAHSWDDVTFGRTPRTEAIALEVKLPIGTATLSGGAVTAIRDALGPSPIGLADLAAAMPSLPAPDLIRGLGLLCATGQVRTYARTAAPCDSSAPARLTSPFNRAVLHERLLQDGAARLVSPLWGAVVQVDPAEGLAVLAVDAGAEDPDVWALDFLAARGNSILIEGKPASSRDAALAVLQPKLLQARKMLLPGLTAMGILG